MFSYFPLGPFVCLDFFFFFLGGGGGRRWVGLWSEGNGDRGTPWVVSTSGLLPDNTGIQREMNNWERGATIHHYSSLYITKEKLRYRSECGFQTLILTFTIS